MRGRKAIQGKPDKRFVARKEQVESRSSHVSTLERDELHPKHEDVRKASLHLRRAACACQRRICASSSESSQTPPQSSQTSVLTPPIRSGLSGVDDRGLLAQGTADTVTHMPPCERITPSQAL